LCRRATFDFDRSPKGLAIKLLTPDEARRIAANIAKLPRRFALVWPGQQFRA
jgi:hypothetical protein